MIDRHQSWKIFACGGESPLTYIGVHERTSAIAHEM